MSYKEAGPTHVSSADSCIHADHCARKYMKRLFPQLLLPAQRSLRAIGLLHTPGQGCKRFHFLNHLHGMLDVIVILWMVVMRILVFTGYFKKSDQISFAALIRAFAHFTNNLWVLSIAIACLRANYHVLPKLQQIWQDPQKIMNAFCSTNTVRNPKMLIGLGTGLVWLAVIVAISFDLYGIFVGHWWDVIWESLYVNQIDWYYLRYPTAIAIAIMNMCNMIPYLLLYSICAGIKHEFDLLHEHMTELTHETDVTVKEIEYYREWHKELCTLVDLADQVLSPLIGWTMILAMSSFCLYLYATIDDLQLQTDVTSIVTFVYWSSITLVLLILTLVWSASVNTKVSVMPLSQCSSLHTCIFLFLPIPYYIEQK